MKLLPVNGKGLWFFQLKRSLFPVAAMVLLASCQTSLFTPPRLTVESGPSQIGPGGTAEPVLLPAPTPTGEPVVPEITLPSTHSNSILTIWVDETSEEHERVLNLMAEEFEREEEISVEMVMVSPALMPELMETAILSDTLPDVVVHPIALTMGWASRDILDAAATDEIIEEIGRDGFDAESLELVNFDGLSAAIPSDGYRQLLLYRSDWQEQHELAPPDSYEAMFAMAESLFDPELLVSGLVVPTESNLTTTQQVFEHLAAANGCQIISMSGEVTIRDPACLEALEFYRTIVNRFSPVGVQTDSSAENAYLSGRTGMIISSPGILPKLAGLDELALPTCPECLDDDGFLAENTGIITELRGYDSSLPGARFSELRYLGITRAADRDTAAAFARFWFNQGYRLWLQAEPEKKVPLRHVPTGQADQFVLDWGALPLAEDKPSMSDIFGREVVNILEREIADSQRWGLKQDQGVLMAKLHQEYTFPIVLQEMLSGYFGSEQTIEEMSVRVIELIPGYEP